MDKRGDVGRVLREEAMRALAVILPLAQNCSKVVDRISEAVCKIIQQSIEKIDATREVVFLEYTQFCVRKKISLLLTANIYNSMADFKTAFDFLTFPSLFPVCCFGNEEDFTIWVKRPSRRRNTKENLFG